MITITSATVYLICHLHGCFVCLFFIIMHWRIAKRIRFKDRSSSEQHKQKQSVILIFSAKRTRTRLWSSRNIVRQVSRDNGYSLGTLKTYVCQYLHSEKRFLNLANCSLSTHICVAVIFTNKLAWGINTFYGKLTVSIKKNSQIIPFYCSRHLPMKYTVVNILYQPSVHVL